MRHFRRTIIGVALAAFFAAGCSAGSTEAAADVADEFIRSFFHADYDAAARLSTGDVTDRLAETKAMADSLSGDLHDAFMELSAMTRTVRMAVNDVARDSVSVEYEIVVPYQDAMLYNTVSVVWIDSLKTWKVNGFN